MRGVPVMPIQLGMSPQLLSSREKGAWRSLWLRMAPVLASKTRTTFFSDEVMRSSGPPVGV